MFVGSIYRKQAVKVSLLCRLFLLSTSSSNCASWILSCFLTLKTIRPHFSAFLVLAWFISLIRLATVMFSSCCIMTSSIFLSLALNTHLLRFSHSFFLNIQDENSILPWKCSIISVICMFLASVFILTPPATPSFDSTRFFLHNTCNILLKN